MGEDPTTPARETQADVTARGQSAAPRSLDIVHSTARAFELDRYLSALLAPHDVRKDLIALAAFAAEIGRVPDFVSEPMIGEIRLQWWRDAVAGATSTASNSGHPIADALAETVRRHALPVDLIVSAIDAQTDRLGDAPFATDAELMANIDRFDGALFSLAWHVLSAGPVHSGDRLIAPPEPIASAARAYGLARTLVELPILLASRRVLVPQERLAAHGLAPDRLHLAGSRSGLAAAVADLAAEAHAEMSKARSALSTVTRAHRVALLPAALVRPYLQVSELSGDAPIKVRNILPISRVARLWIAARWGVL